MEITINTFLQRLGVENQHFQYFEDAKIERSVFNKAQNAITVYMTLKKTLPFYSWKHLVQKALDYFSVAQVYLVIDAAEIATVNGVDNYISYFYKRQEPQLGVTPPLVQVIDKQVTCSFTDEASLQLALDTIKDLETFVNNAGFKGYQYHFDVYKDTFNYTETKVATTPAQPMIKEQPNKPKYRARNHQYTPIAALKLINEQVEKVVIKGKIFNVETVENRHNQRWIMTVYIHDTDSAFIAKFFEGQRFSRAALEALKPGQSVRISGNVENDRYLNDLVLLADKVEMIDDIFKVEDNAIEKRVELHAHTNKSEMDGIPSATALVNYAFKMGHQAVAITDHNVVQSFPEAQNAVSKLLKSHPDRQFKVLYGVEFSMVDTQVNIIHHPDDRPIGHDYVVFDLETSGLSNKYDKIIEFGAVKVRQGTIVDRKQLFINPQITLEAFTTNLTGIKQEDVDHAPLIEDVIDDILEFIGDDVLVAHNAEFDVDFLQAVLASLNKPPLTNQVIDTLNLSRVLHKHRRAHRLGNVARFYGITYDENGAHRADYDAEVLTAVLMNMLTELKNLNCQTYNDIQNLQDKSIFSKVRPKHIVAIAKTPEGLKDLFKLVTLAHTTYLATTTKANSTSEISMAEPLITREEIQRYRENLLIGSACYHGEIFENAANKSQQQLDELIDFYDYIEIQHPDNYQALINSGSIKNKERLEMILTNIVETAQAHNKLVVATGDVHYLGPEDKVLRDVYINAQGVGGVRHPLFIYDANRRRLQEAPNQHFRSTDEMLAGFSFLPHEIAYQIVITNTQQIASQTQTLYPVKDRLYTPSIEGADEKLKAICYETAYSRYGNPLPEIVSQRLEKELGKIIQHGFAVIYYIAHLLVKESLDHGYVVGSRGSVGSSFVATMANITEVNPLPPHYYCPHCQHSEFITDGSVSSGYDLPDKKCPHCDHMMKVDGQDIPFETFLGFEGDKVPDIDLNFSSEFQDKAHAFTKTIFGEDKVFRAGTIGTVANKTAFGYVLKYFEDNEMVNVSTAMKVRLALGCEGVKRTTGQHPGGIIVIPHDMDVHDFSPVQYPANNPNSEWKTTHFEFADIHDNVLKLDILGHVDPTAMKLLERISGINIREIPMNDPKVMALFNSLDTLNIDSRHYSEKTGAVGLPEFGTSFVRGILELTKPTTFSDLVRISGLSHGTDVWLNNAKDLIEQGQTLNQVIGCRDDIMTVLIHKGLKPKDAFDIMESVRKGRGLTDKWIQIMKENNVPDWYIDSCLKIKYMFPKAHAVAYVIMAIRVAWFKVYHPEYYYVSFFTLRSDAYDIETMINGKESIEQRLNSIQNRLNNYETQNQVSKKEKDILITLEVALEMHLRGYRFANISLQQSLATEFLVDPNDHKVLIPPFATVDGLGANVAKSIVEARNELPFISKEDIIKRTQLSNTLLAKLENMHVLDGLQDENQLSLF